MTCTRTKSKYVRKDAQHECHGGAPPAPAPSPASVPTPTPVELYLRPVNATGHKSQPAVEPEIAVQLPKQLPGLRRPNSNFPFSILLPPASPSLSPSSCRSAACPACLTQFVLCFYCIYAYCDADAVVDAQLIYGPSEPFPCLRLLLPPCQEWKYGKAAYSKLSNKGRRDREQ